MNPRSAQLFIMPVYTVYIYIYIDMYTEYTYTSIAFAHVRPCSMLCACIQCMHVRILPTRSTNRYSSILWWPVYVALLQNVDVMSRVLCEINGCLVVNEGQCDCQA